MKYLLLSAPVLLLAVGAFADPGKDLENAAYRYVETRANKVPHMFEAHKEDIREAAHDLRVGCMLDAKKVTEYLNMHSKKKNVGPGNPASDTKGIGSKCRKALDDFDARMKELDVLPR